MIVAHIKSELNAGGNVIKLFFFVTDTRALVCSMANLFSLV
jgi:hypothetical protein